MKKILVPCDFSKPAINAYRHALDLAHTGKGTVELLHVIELPILNDTVLMPVLNFEKELLQELKEKSGSRFEKMISKYPSKSVKVKTNVVFGTPALVIADFIVKNKIDLVVMGSHGTTGIRELIIGSNAEKIVRKSTAPVIVVKDYKKLRIKDIVFPNNFYEGNQDDLVKQVKVLQSDLKAKLHLVRINTIVNFKSDLETLAEMKAFAVNHGLRNYSINIFNAVNEERGIIAFANHIKADLIAMGTHGRKGLAHLFNGSSAEDVVNHASLPIWTYAIKNIPIEA
jgi:nucleotide-binding universal stress UspA family protein